MEAASLHKHRSSNSNAWFANNAPEVRVSSTQSVENRDRGPVVLSLVYKSKTLKTRSYHSERFIVLKPVLEDTFYYESIFYRDILGEQNKGNKKYNFY